MSVVQDFFPIAKRMFEALDRSQDDRKIGSSMRKILNEGCASFTNTNYEWIPQFKEEIKRKRHAFMGQNSRYSD